MKSHPLRPRVGIAIAATTIALVFAVPPPAAAHDGLVASTPSAGSTVTIELESISLTFSNELIDIGDSNGAFAIQVVGSDGLYYNLDCVRREGPTAWTSVALGESGSYEVTWQVISSDGHLSFDSFNFAYEKPADTVAVPGAVSAPCSANNNGGAAGESADASEAAADALTMTGVWAIVGGIVAFLAVSAVVVATIGARNRRGRRSRPINSTHTLEDH